MTPCWCWRLDRQCEKSVPAAQLLEFLSVTVGTTHRNIGSRVFLGGFTPFLQVIVVFPIFTGLWDYRVGILYMGCCD